MSTQSKGRERFEEKVARQKAEVEKLTDEIEMLTQAEKDGILAVVELKKAIRRYRVSYYTPPPPIFLPMVSLCILDAVCL
jgi:hypothetical protein